MCQLAGVKFEDIVNVSLLLSIVFMLSLECKKIVNLRLLAVTLCLILF
jgi:hypothetical protein